MALIVSVLRNTCLTGLQHSPIIAVVQKFEVPVSVHTIFLAFITTDKLLKFFYKTNQKISRSPLMSHTGMPLSIIGSNALVRYPSKKRFDFFKSRGPLSNNP